MPAFETRMSILPYFATVSAMPCSTWASSVTFIATAKASPPLALISSAAAVRGVEVEVGDHRGGALGGEAEGDLLADAAGGAGDDRDPSIEAGHLSSPFRVQRR